MKWRKYQHKEYFVTNMVKFISLNSSHFIILNQRNRRKCDNRPWVHHLSEQVQDQYSSPTQRCRQHPVQQAQLPLLVVTSTLPELPRSCSAHCYHKPLIHIQRRGCITAQCTTNVKTYIITGCTKYIVVVNMHILNTKLRTKWVATCWSCDSCCQFSWRFGLVVTRWLRST